MSVISPQTNKGEAYLYIELCYVSRYPSTSCPGGRTSPLAAALTLTKGAWGSVATLRWTPGQVPPQLRHVPVLHHQPDLLTPHRPQRCSAPDMEAMFDHAMYGGCRGCPGPR